MLCEDEPVNDKPNQHRPFLMGLIEAGKLAPIINKTYPLEQAAAGMRYLEAGHVRGKVVVRVGELVRREIGEDSARANGSARAPKTGPKYGMCRSILDFPDYVSSLQLRHRHQRGVGFL